MSQDYYSALARTIAAIGQDHAQLRMMIYKFVRSELRSELFRRKGIRWTEMKEQTSALERAIDRIEVGHCQQPRAPGYFFGASEWRRGDVQHGPRGARKFAKFTS